MELSISGTYPNAKLPLLENLKKSFLITSTSFSSNSLIHSVNGISLKTNNLVASFPVMGCFNQSISSVEKVGDLISNHGGSPLAIKRKKLAVFVSGGGSNFRSIHEACIDGSIHGDIAVLVTNKRGVFSSNCFV